MGRPDGSATGLCLQGLRAFVIAMFHSVTSYLLGALLELSFFMWVVMFAL